MNMVSNQRVSTQKVSHECGLKRMWSQTNKRKPTGLQWTSWSHMMWSQLSAHQSWQWRIQTRRLRGAVKLGGAKKIFICLNTKVCLRQSLGVTEKWLPFEGQKVAIFVGRTTRFSGKNHSLKALCIIDSEKIWSGSQNRGPRFSQATQISYIYKMYLKGIKACCAQAFATVLAIRSEISEEQCLKRIPDLLRSRTVLLRLTSDNSYPMIELK